ncbi:rRNA maturation RNase YbeY [Pseudooceanicola atlanticus]|uniref:Endoribonuclease YbeY n=1 Tax=Pseudooceanicola atlanticus TaxID=1461694 RepID=A0A0A0EH26_9RHOB|nr:rRNA maturation RNase YbeY [Pseudooceanicola atlanticus]KGM50271.1 rRNA maturation factor [Pseudooceanicola atlanticus]
MAVIDCIIEDERWTALGLEDLAERAARETLAHLGLDPADFEIALLACDDTRIAELNTEFRDKPTPTNVLSWPSDERGMEDPGAVPDLPDPGPDSELGDIAIAWETCDREAREAGKSAQDHATHLIVHAVLHLLGYDHVRDLDATLMEQVEVAILGKMGLPDPYDV